jgi:apolipoprotein N-acyltransferase
LITDAPKPRGLHERIARPALALGAGTLVAVSMPPWGFWPLAVVGVALFEVALGAVPTRRERRRLGFLFGAGWMFLGLAWMVQLTAPGYVVAATVFASFHMVAALVSPTGPWRVIGRPAAHSLAEALRFSFPFGGVPLATLGMSQVGGPFVGIVRVGGVILLTWVILQLGFALAVLAPRARALVRHLQTRSPREPQAAIALLAVVLVMVLSTIAPRGSATGDTLDVAAVQGGGEQGTSALEVPPTLVTRRHLEATRSIPTDRHLDLVLWPENTVDVGVFDGSPEYRAIAAEAMRLDAPIAVGVTEQPRVNSQTLVAPDGEIIGKYVKVRRVPYGEYVPLRGLLEALGAPVGQVGRDANAGTGPAVLDLPDGTRLAVVISWEVFFAGRAREGVKLGGEAIINPTNGASYTGTIVQSQQVASSRLRAIENGRWVVQAAPTGFTAIVDADGNVRQRTGVSERKVLYDTVELRTGRTWYTDIGDGPFIVALLMLFGASRWFARRRSVDVDHERDRPVVDQLDAHVGAEPSGFDRGAE